MIKKIMICLFISSLSISTFAQLSVGGHFSSINFLAGSEVKNTGFAISVNYGLDDIKDGLVAYGGIGIYSAYKQEGSFVASANSNTTVPSNLNVNYTNELPLTNVFIGLKKYFVGDYDDENFGIYGIGQLGYMSSKSTLKIDNYDEANYSLNLIEGDDKASNFMISLGAGFEKGFDFGFFFGEAKINLTANEENGQQVLVEIPASTELNVGYRYMF